MFRGKPLDNELKYQGSVGGTPQRPEAPKADLTEVTSVTVLPYLGPQIASLPYQITDLERIRLGRELVLT